MAMFQTTESLGGSTVSSSTPADKVVHTIPTPSGRKYIVFFSCDFSISNVNTRAKIDLKVDGNVVATFSPRVNATQEVHNVFFFEQVTGKTASFDCEIEISSTNNSNNITVQNARIVSWDYTDIESELDIQYGADNTNRALPASFDDNGARVSFTPPSTGNYFVLGCGGIAPGSTSVSAIMRMVVAGTAYPLATDTNAHFSREAPAVVTDAFYNANFGTRQSLATGASRLIEIEARNESGTTGTWQYTRVLAFREDAFVDADYASGDTGSEYNHGQSTSYSTRATNTTDDPGTDAMDYLILAGGFAGDRGDTAENERSELTVTIAGTEVIQLETRSKEPSTPADYQSVGVAAKRSDASAFTALVRLRGQGGLLDNDIVSKNSFVIVLRDDVPEGTQVNDERSAKTHGIATISRENETRMYGGYAGGSFVDSFDNTTYKDTGNTTASWTGDGQIKYP